MGSARARSPWLVVAIAVAAACSDSSPAPSPAPPPPPTTAPSASPFRTVLQLSPPDDSTVVGAFVEVYEAPPADPSALRYAPPVPLERTPEDLLGVVIGIPLARENGEPIGLAGGGRGPRAFTIPRGPGPSTLTLVAVVDGDVTSVVQPPPCAAPPCASHTVAAADLVLVLPAADVASHTIGPGWRFVIDP